MTPYDRFKRMIPALALAFCLAVIPQAVGAQTFPAPTAIQTDQNIGLPGQSWTAYVRDTALTESWGRVDLNSGITQMTTSDSLRIYSSNEADSTKIALVIINAAFERVTVSTQLNGADTIFISTKAWKVLAAFCDTTSAGTISIKAKTGTSALATITAGKLQTYAAEYFFSSKGGAVTQLEVFPQPFSPMVEYQVRLYRNPTIAIQRPETGYSILYEGFTGGPPTIRPHVAKKIVAALDDTSVTFYLVSPGTAYNWAAVTTAVGTSNTAYYFRDSPDASTWNLITAIDSLDTTGLTTTANLRYKTATLNSAGGPYFQFIANGKAAAADTSTITTYVTPATWSQDLTPLIKPMREACPAYSYAVVYARCFGKNGKIAMRLMGFEVR